MPQRPQIHFISLDKTWTNKATIAFHKEPNVLITHGNITDFPKEGRTFVSPANSLGFMDGGIDMVLSRTMFPGLQTKVQDRIKAHGIKTGLGRYYLPIASAISVPTQIPSSFVIAAPTMFLPHDVSATENAYWSFLAALALHSKQSVPTTLVATSHCCGYGCMPVEKSVEQMYRAYSDFMAGRVPADSMSEMKDVVVFPSQDETQPANYDNREIKEILVTEISLKR